MNDEQIILAGLDIETTGLEVGHHEPIEVGIKFYDVDGNVLGFIPFSYRLMPMYPDRIHPKAQELNGFDEEEWRETSVSKKQFVYELRSMFRSAEHHFDNENIRFVMTGLNISFDKEWLDWILRSVDSAFSYRSFFHYRVFDVSSFAFGIGIHNNSGDNMADVLGLEKESIPHRAIHGVEHSMKVYRALLDMQMDDSFTKMAASFPVPTS